MSARPLWPHQVRALDTLRAAFDAGWKRVVLASPTGSGKTRLSAEAIGEDVRQGRRVGFIVPALALIDQCVGSFEREGLRDLGVLQGRHPRTDPRAPVQIISAQTLSRRERPALDVVYVDECHLMHKGALSWMRDRPDMRFVGLSATPWTRGLGRHWQRLIQVATTAEMIEAGTLCRFRVFAPVRPDLTDVHVVAGEYEERSLSEAVSQTGIIGDVVKEWLARAANRPTVAFCVNRQHARNLKARFLAAGVACEYVDGETPREDRTRLFDALATGEVQVIASVGVLVAGVDIPSVACILDCAPTRSEIKLCQSWGRGLRTAEGKNDCLVIDCGGNALRLGLPTTIIHTRLDDGTQRQAEREPVELSACQSCSAILPRGATVCPECGAARGRQVEEIDGELAEVKETDVDTDERALFFAELKWIGQERGYKSGWPNAVYKDVFGHWPEFFVAPVEPRPKTRMFIRERNREYAMQQGGAR